MNAPPSPPVACRFTVFTPTYNRALTLPRVYASLVRQTLRDFEWLIVDDGSTDETRVLVEEWQRAAAFPIRYFHQENQGKPAACNLGVAEARGEFVLPFDSDDACVPQTLERFALHWQAIPEDDKPRFSGVTCLCENQHGTLVGDRFPADVFDSDWLEMQYRHRIEGEKWGFHRTEILRDFPFPKIRGHVPEGPIWNAIARCYQTRFINEPLRIYYRDEVGRTDQIMQDGDPGRDARGLVWGHEDTLGHDLPWFRFAPAKFLFAAAHYTRFSLHAGLALPAQFRKLPALPARLLAVAMSPLGVFAYLRDKQLLNR